MAEQKKQTKIGYSMVTYQVRLYDRHFVWLEQTQKLYANVVEHFFFVLKKEEALLELSDFLLLRALETKCIGTKEMKAKGILPEYPLEGFPKIPLYFRRSAINTAIALARKQAERTQFLHLPMTLYKGMYQNFTDTSIELKLFNGERWVWVTYPFIGREFPEGAKRFSPMLVRKKKNTYLYVPVSFEVEDIRTVQERMQTEDRICAISFPDYDVLAVAVLFSKEGEELGQKFFRGGKQKEFQRKRILNRLLDSRQSRGGKEQQETAESTRENKAIYEKLQNLNRHYAHLISKQILDYCLEQNIKLIVVPKYETGIDFREKRYLKTDAYRWIGRSIIQKLKYKAFQHGIVVTSIRPYHISDTCSFCGATIQKYNEGHTAGKNYYGGKLFQCPNGHKGNTAWNSARNIGKTFLSYYKEEK